jgi:hypothetical protein
LEPLVAHLVIACFAEQTDRAWVLHGTVLEPPPELTAISADLTLREQRLPSEDAWQVARQRAMEVFGVNAPELRRGRLVGIFARQLVEAANAHRTAADYLVELLERHAARLGIEPSAAEGRLPTARAAAALLDGLGTRRGSVEVVEHLARADLGGPAPRTGRSIRSAQRVADALAGASWDAFDLVAGLGEPYAAEAAAIFAPLRRAAQADELTVSLPEALTRARSATNELLRKATAQQVPEEGRRRGPSEQQRPGTASGARRVTAAEVESVLDELRVFVVEHRGETVEVTWRVVE